MVNLQTVKLWIHLWWTKAQLCSRSNSNSVDPHVHAKVGFLVDRLLISTFFSVINQIPFILARSSKVIESTEEKQAKDLVERGDIDQAIAIYQRIQPQSGRILHLLGVLYTERKGDQQAAVNCFQQALQMKEEVCVI